VMFSGTHPLTSTGGAETVGGPAHTHAMGAHAHPVGHSHNLGGHTHGINHDHAAVLSGQANVTGTLGNVTGGTIAFSVDTHRHNVDVAALSGVDSLGPGPADTGTSTISNTGAPSPGATDAASYTEQIATMPPYIALSYIIRLG
jgi:hypothetical protein